jgi:hypothetical protein
MSVPSSPSVLPVVLSAALYINCTVPPCSAVPHYIHNTATLYTRRHINSSTKNRTALLSTVRQCSKLRVCSHVYFWWFFWDIIPYSWVKIPKLHGTQYLSICKAMEHNMEQKFHCTYNVISWCVRVFTVAVEKKEVIHILICPSYKAHSSLSGFTLFFTRSKRRTDLRK